MPQLKLASVILIRSNFPNSLFAEGGDGLAAGGVEEDGGGFTFFCQYGVNLGCKAAVIHVFLFYLYLQE